MFPLDKKETRVQALGGENPLEKDMATHSSILAWWIPRTEEPGKLVHRVTETWLKQLSICTQPLWIPSLCFLASLEAPRPFNPVTVPGISQYSFSWAPQSLSCCLCNPGPSSEPQNLEAGKKKKVAEEWAGLDFPDDPVGKNLPTDAGDMGLIPDLGRSHMLQNN